MAPVDAAGTSAKPVFLFAPVRAACSWQLAATEGVLCAGGGLAALVAPEDAAGSRPHCAACVPDYLHPSKSRLQLTAVLQRVCCAQEEVLPAPLQSLYYCPPQQEPPAADSCATEGMLRAGGGLVALVAPKDAAGSWPHCAACVPDCLDPSKSCLQPTAVLQRVCCAQEEVL